jgi:magnesium transporter
MRQALKIKDIELLKDYVEGDIYARLLASRHACLALEDGAFLILFHYCDIKDPSHKEEKVCIYCSADHFIFLSNNAHCKKLLGEMNDQIDHFTLLLHFFQNLTANDVYDLEKIEDGITSLEDQLLMDKEIEPYRTSQIIGLRRELLKMKRYYEQLSLVTHELAENANNAISKDLLKKFHSVDRRIGYLLNSILHLREYVTQVREAYQAQIDIEQNHIMRIFTVITSVFLPLTLIVGWYGMNLQMPEYTWRFGYLCVILLSIAVFIGSIVFFKRKKWF